MRTAIKIPDTFIYALTINIANDPVLMTEKDILLEEVTTHFLSPVNPEPWFCPSALIDGMGKETEEALLLAEVIFNVESSNNLIEQFGKRHKGKLSSTTSHLVAFLLTIEKKKFPVEFQIALNTTIFRAFLLLAKYSLLGFKEPILREINTFKETYTGPHRQIFDDLVEKLNDENFFATLENIIHLLKDLIKDKMITKCKVTLFVRNDLGRGKSYDFLNHLITRLENPHSYFFKLLEKNVVNQRNEFLIERLPKFDYFFPLNQFNLSPNMFSYLLQKIDFLNNIYVTDITDVDQAIDERDIHKIEASKRTELEREKLGFLNRIMPLFEKLNQISFNSSDFFTQMGHFTVCNAAVKEALRKDALLLDGTQLNITKTLLDNQLPNSLHEFVLLLVELQSHHTSIVFFNVETYQKIYRVVEIFVKKHMERFKDPVRNLFNTHIESLERHTFPGKLTMPHYQKFLEAIITLANQLGNKDFFGSKMNVLKLINQSILENRLSLATITIFDVRYSFKKHIAQWVSFLETLKKQIEMETGVFSLKAFIQCLDLYLQETPSLLAQESPETHFNQITAQPSINDSIVSSLTSMDDALEINSQSDEVSALRR